MLQVTNLVCTRLGGCLGIPVNKSTEVSFQSLCTVRWYHKLQPPGTGYDKRRPGRSVGWTHSPCLPYTELSHSCDSALPDTPQGTDILACARRHDTRRWCRTDFRGRTGLGSGPRNRPCRQDSRWQHDTHSDKHRLHKRTPVTRVLI